MMQIDRTELAIWAEGSEYATDDLVRKYRSYLTACEAGGVEPLGESRWAEEVMGIANPTIEGDAFVEYARRWAEEIKGIDDQS